MTDIPTPCDEARLWVRTMLGIAVGLAALALFGFVVMTMITPGLNLASRIAIAAFLGFWSGPFFGATAALAYNQHTAARPIARRLPIVAQVHPGTTAALPLPQAA